MKRMKIITGMVLTGILALSCIACGAKEQTAVCTMESPDVGVTIEMTIEATGDIVHTMKQINTMDLSGYTEDQIQMIEETVNEYGNAYADYEGAVYTTELTEDSLVETLIIDATDADTLNGLSESGLLPMEGESSRISLEKTVENLEEQGWTVTLSE